MPFYTLYKRPSPLLNSGSILPKNSMRVACLLFSSLLLPIVITKNLLIETQGDVKFAVAPTTKANEMDRNGVKGSKWIKRDQNGIKGSKWIERDQNGVEGSNGKVGMDYIEPWLEWDPSMEVFGPKIKLTSSSLPSLF